MAIASIDAKKREALGISARPQGQAGLLAHRLDIDRAIGVLKIEGPAGPARAAAQGCCHQDIAPRLARILPTGEVLKEGYGPEPLEEGFRQAINDFNKPGHAGPVRHVPIPGTRSRIQEFHEQPLTAANA